MSVDYTFALWTVFASDWPARRDDDAPINWSVFITDTERVYRAVRAEYLNIVRVTLWSLKS
jgi:hypothetical protein